MNVDEKRFKQIILSNYRVLIDELKNKVNNSIHFIDFSEYASQTVSEPKRLINEFMLSEKIPDSMIKNIFGNFQLSLSTFLFMQVFNEIQEMNAELFNTIIGKNNTLN